MFRNKFLLYRNLSLLFITCNLLYWLFPFPPIVWRLSLVLLSLFVVFFEERKRLRCERIVLVFVFFNLFHFFISLLWQDTSLGWIGNVLYAFLSLSLFTCLAEQKVMTDRFISTMAIILLGAAIFHYFQIESEVIKRLNIDEDRDITNNASAAFLMLLPMLFLMNNSLQRWITLMVCVYFILMSAKRGNIIAAIVPVILFVYSEMRSSRHSGIKSVLVLAVFFSASYAIYNMALNDEYLMSRIEQTQEGNSSGRDIIYSGAWHAWYDSDNFATLMFGKGFDGILQLESTSHMHAHNDWLEVLVNYGLLGVLLYLAVFISLILQVRKIESFELKMSFLSGLFSWFLKSLYSMGFGSEDLCISMISMGIVLGRYKAERSTV